MFNLKAFPDFKASSNVGKADNAMLAQLKRIKNQGKAIYISFSIHDYQHDNPDSLYFVTYPLRWMTEYIRNNYIEIDPLLHLDYRRASLVDWEDVQAECKVQKMFQKFQEYGLGSNGITVTGHICKSQYGALGLTFELGAANWADFKRENLDLFQFLTAQLCDRYSDLYHLSGTPNFQLTRRELQCLYWIAIGKTDNQISNLMNIGKWTVVSHVKSAKQKLKTPNRASAVAIAISEGLIDIRKSG